MLWVNIYFRKKSLWFIIIKMYISYITSKEFKKGGLKINTEVLA